MSTQLNSDPADTADAAEIIAAPTSAAPSPSGIRRTWLVALVAAGYVAQVALRLFLIRGSTVPVAHIDEDGYLLIARALAGGPGGYTNENGPFLRVGFGLILAPVYIGTSDAFDVYHRALVLEAFISALIVPLAVLFARRVVGMSIWWAAGAGITVAMLPAVLYYSSTVLTDAVLGTLALGWLVLLHGWLTTPSRRPRWAYAVGSGAVAGLMYAIHVRGTMVLIAHVVVAVLVLVSQRDRRLSALGTVTAGLLFAGVDQLCKWLLGDSIVVLGDSPKSQIASVFGADWRIALVVLRVLGQVWYLAIGTLGFGFVGLILTVSLLGSRKRRRLELAEPGGAARLLTMLAALVATALIVAGSATSLPFGEHRITYFAYPRYIHFLFPVWLLIGLGAMLRAGARTRTGLAVSTVGLVVLAAAVLRWSTVQAPGYFFINFDVPEMLALSGQWERFTVWTPTLASLALFSIMTLGLAWRRSAMVVIAALAGLCVVVAPLAQAKILRPMAQVQYRPDTPRLVRDVHLGPGDVVAEAYQTPYPFPFNHAREVTWQRLILFDANVPPPTQANVVIAPWFPYGNGPSWNGANFGMRQISGDPFHGWAVWRR